MTEEGRRFTIERIRKYNIELDEREKEIRKNAFWSGMYAFFTFYCIGLNFNSSDSVTSIKDFLEYIISSPFAIGFQAVFTLDNLINTVKAISRKTGIEIKIEDLEAQLELDRIEEKGKNR